MAARSEMAVVAERAEVAEVAMQASRRPLQLLLHRSNRSFQLRKERSFAKVTTPAIAQAMMGASAPIRINSVTSAIGAWAITPPLLAGQRTRLARSGKAMTDAGIEARAARAARAAEGEIPISLRQCLLRWRPLFFQISRWYP